ncbi:MFS transporter [Dactylosporangium aurantiacum]|uniref:MFS transporter n=1 Tax=Dactylosporangium aurantiacum TaxID=35754 RepID=A0A9Q9MGB5_9ACTN|nr:MFS transporter [Dactylosporangium aurantiacum]MDG6109884.1 MFS transporter [Dactylosporangium aurantiacum]UWZ58118.1 MFS transporter [Dactylosporangium aurantiacum]
MAGHRPAGGLLRTRTFALLWVAQSTSAVGSAVTTVALPLVAIETLRAAPAEVALLTAATWLPWLLVGLPAGVWVDRWPRRRTLLVADVVSAAVLVAVPVAAWTGVLTMRVLLVAALLAGAAGVFASVAFNAFLPRLVGADDLMEGNAKLQTSASVALVVGPGLGGLLAQAAGPVSGVLLDAGTFLLSAVCLLGIRSGPEPRPGHGDRPGMLRQIAEGVGFVMRGRLLQAMLVVAAVTNFAMLGITALRVVFLVRAEGTAPGTAGLVIGVGGLGAILGAAVAARVSRRYGSARTYLLANVAAAPFVLLLPLGGHGPRLALFAAGSFVALAGATMSNVMTMTFRGTFVPAHLLGRVTAASRIFVFGTVPFGAATAGVLASALGVRSAMWALAVLYVAAPLPLLATEARTLRDLPARPAEP